MVTSYDGQLIKLETEAYDDEGKFSNTYENDRCNVVKRYRRDKKENRSRYILDTSLIHLRLEVYYSGYKTYELDKIVGRYQS